MESMPDPYTRLPRKLEIFRRFSYFTLFIERLTLAFWAMGVWIVVFCGLWLLKIPSALGEDAHRFAAILFYSGLTYFLWRGARVIRLPSPREADRRLEDSAGLWHRPLSRLTDRLINPLTEVARLLWEESARDARLSLHRLKIPVPRALMAAADPRALRLGGLLLLMCGFIMAGPSWKERLARGIFPFQFTGLAGPGDSVSVWITPPEYTGRPALVLRSPDPKHGDHKAPEVLEIPAGSTIKILVSGSGWGSPSVRIGAQTWPLEKSGEGIYGIERPFPEPSADKPEKGRIVVRQYFLTRATWNFISVEDFPPAIALDGEPEILPDGVLRFSLRVRDDYGVKDVVLSVDAPEKETASVVGGSYRETRPVMSPPGKDFGIAPVYDLTAHPWAGARAMVHFTAVDTQGVETQTPPIEILLPERVFTHPAARMIAAIRKTLIEAPEKDYDAAGVAVEDLLSRPSDFGNDSVTVLVLRAAASRLFYTRPSVETTSSLAALLWDTALRIEDGNLTHAVRDLKSAQEALEQALRDPKTSGPEL
ncbi:MAG: DUF4175 domain-containing protein, partial [Alphaproteobacteria bacterium]|nr:DUF4175 domain-containing protein [Alphaproteobacteria bacterium]